MHVKFMLAFFCTLARSSAYTCTECTDYRQLVLCIQSCPSLTEGPELSLEVSSPWTLRHTGLTITSVGNLH